MQFPISVEIRSVLTKLSGYSEKDVFQISQNGVKYRTLCKKCNSWLGHEYDPTLNKFAEDISRFAHSSLSLPPIIEIETKPHRLIRAILGHLIAAKVDYDDAEFDEQVRDFIFDSKAPVPSDIHIFYWVYPYEISVVIRDIIMPSQRGDFNQTMYCQLIKYFPISSLVTTASKYEGLFELTRYRDAQIDDVIAIRINLKEIQQQDWPETPDKGNFVVGGQALASSAVSKPRKK